MQLKAKEINYQEKIVEYSKILKQQIKKLDTHIDTVLQKHEQDFLNAFKCQMFNLHSQLKELKKKNDENELRLKRDDQIIKLQKALDWFRDEAVKLGESTQHYKKESEKWKAKAESLEDDRKFLENQLKATKRKIKLLQVEKDDSKDSESFLQTSFFKTQDQCSTKFSPSCKSGDIVLELYHKSNHHIDDFMHELEKFFNDLENKYNLSIKHIKNSLEAERRRFKTMSAQQTSVFFAKSDLENLFLECIEEVRKDAIKRKLQNAANQKYLKRCCIGQKDDISILKSSDKRKILELLISNEQVLIFLYEKLFPHRANQYGNTFRTEDKTKTDQTPELEELLKQVPYNQNTSKSRYYSYRGKSMD
ncbi:hypothetical protein SteCoe_35499 [Stentor coeruleus]|uniref:Uncharacterized protein n=1 Tax=Stentor coeruleus TaxID=5963 RepID=A0A1R2AS38_9CILI|nr:hypothetical protein SteCoe_35499 [Stentor coeruleus]